MDERLRKDTRQRNCASFHDCVARFVLNLFCARVHSVSRLSGVTHVRAPAGAAEPSVWFAFWCEVLKAIKYWPQTIFLRSQIEEKDYLRIVIVFQAYFSTIAIFCSSLEECELRYFLANCIFQKLFHFIFSDIFFGDKSYPERNTLSWTQTLHMNIIFLETERLDGQSECHCRGSMWQSSALTCLFCYKRMTRAGQAVISGATCWTEEAQPPPSPRHQVKATQGAKGNWRTNI